MALIDLYSKRQRKLRGEIPDVYSYESIPKPLKVQIVQIWTEALGEAGKTTNTWTAYELIVKTLRREYGVFRLDTGAVNPDDELSTFFLSTRDVELCIDVIEIAFRVIDRVTRRYEYQFFSDYSARADSAISELNARFQEHGVGYQFINSEIIRIDSQLLHAEVVKPAIMLLNSKEYRGPQQEFLTAHQHYRSGKSKEALNECLKAFESMMKAVCDKRGWTYQTNAAAKDLIHVCFENGLIPSFWQTQFTSLRSLLESSVPTGRNKLSGHGQGSIPSSVPSYLVAFMLHMTASCIVFIAEAETNLP